MAKQNKAKAEEGGEKLTAQPLTVPAAKKARRRPRKPQGRQREKFALVGLLTTSGVILNICRPELGMQIWTVLSPIIFAILMPSRNNSD